MNGKIWSAACGAIMAGAVAAVFAQPPTSSPSQATSQSTSGKKIMVTGCVARAQQSPTGTTGATGAAAANEPKFILTNAAVDTSKAPGATGTSGTSGMASTAASEYRLDATESKLSDHVGHKVEITGTIEESAMGEKPSTSAATSPTLKVSNVKMISTTCPSS